MREIKFRAWITSQEVMSKVGTLQEILFSKSHNVSMFDLQNDIKFMQYTGLKDKNGVEIYEGDILEIGEHGKGKVVFMQSSFMAEWIDDEAYSELLANIIWKERNNPEHIFEVIGNIYENPKLASR